MSVSAVIPNWNRRDLLVALLERLKGQTVPIGEIIVVDNGSTDGSADEAERFGATVIRLTKNPGFCRAVNEGLARCRGEWIAVLNNDVEPAPDWLELLLGAVTPSHWFACGKLLNAQSRQILDGTFDLVARSACAWRAGHGCPDSSSWSRPREIWSAPFTAVLFRACLIDKVGQLDEDFESYLEDIDFGIRCQQVNCRGLFVPEALAWHAGSATFGKWSPDTVRLIARNQLLLIAKHYPDDWLFRYGWPVLVGQSLWGLLALRHGQLFPFLRGKTEGVRMFGPKRAASPRGYVAPVLEGGEREIRELQSSTASDLYWRLYFALT